MRCFDRNREDSTGLAGKGCDHGGGLPGGDLIGYLYVHLVLTGIEYRRGNSVKHNGYAADLRFQGARSIESPISRQRGAHSRSEKRDDLAGDTAPPR